MKFLIVRHLSANVDNVDNLVKTVIEWTRKDNVKKV